MEGMGLLYTQKLLHEGSVVTEGQKYVLRSDVLFGQPEPAVEKEEWRCILQ